MSWPRPALQARQLDESFGGELYLIFSANEQSIALYGLFFRLALRLKARRKKRQYKAFAASRLEAANYDRAEDRLSCRGGLLQYIYRSCGIDLHQSRIYCLNLALPSPSQGSRSKPA